MSGEAPAFFYIKRSTFEAAQACKHECWQNVISSRRGNEDDVHICLVEAPPTLIDRAWNLMTEDEKALLRPPWSTDSFPDQQSIEKLVAWMREQATRALGAADKLEAAAKGTT